jgi:hypothetical protein
MSDTIVRLLKTRVRGVNLMGAMALVCPVALALSVYLFKAGASQEGARISDLDSQITAELRDVRRLREDVTRLDQPARIEHLSAQYLTLQPVKMKQEVRPSDLSAVVRRIPAPVTTTTRSDQR